MSKSIIWARFEVKQFAGYCIWWVRRRKTKTQKWDKAPLFCGRTDTCDQAWGQAYRILADVNIEELRDGAMWERWSLIRLRLRKPTDGTWGEGKTEWDKTKLENGPEWLQALAEDGRRFQEQWDTENKRRDDEFRERQRQHFEWMLFTEETGRDHSDRSDEAYRAFARWRVERILKREEQKRAYEEMFSRVFVFTFGPNRADDLATLGLDQRATSDDIKRAWRRAAMKLHPDRGGDHEKFIRAKAAFERLMQ
jgi:hypothetical protein